MSERLVISVDSSNGSDLLTVQDVFQHVLGIFQLIAESEPTVEGRVKWRLVSARMNSPFTVVAEALPATTGDDIGLAAKQQKTAFQRNFAELRSGSIPSSWTTDAAKRAVADLLNRVRSMRTVTTISDDGAPVIVISDDLPAVEVLALGLPPPVAVKTKSQIGTVEGKLVEVRNLYGKPAFRLLERRSNEVIWCIVPPELAHRIAASTSLEDVWAGSRAHVRGLVHYNSNGKISRVEATSVRRVDTKEVPDSRIADKDFTGGLSVTEYLERLRDGSLG